MTYDLPYARIRDINIFVTEKFLNHNKKYLAFIGTIHGIATDKQAVKYCYRHGKSFWMDLNPDPNKDNRNYPFLYSGDTGLTIQWGQTCESYYIIPWIDVIRYCRIMFKKFEGKDNKNIVITMEQ